ncbi:MAG: hypothetical protein ACOC35_09710 [Promethearchaeia archaeon]
MSEKPMKPINKPAVEEVIFYLDILGKHIKKKRLIKSVKKFIAKKNNYNSSETSFGLVLFLEQDNPITIYDSNEADEILEILKDSWKEREQNQSRFENGLFEILSYVFRQSKKEARVFRIIILSDSPSKRSEEYHRAVYELISKSKQFNTYIDVLRIGDQKFYEDDIKLKIITSETQGGIFYCQTEEQFENIFLSLIKNKQEYNKIQPEEEGNIKKEDKTFYEKMAAELITLEPNEDQICSLCQLEICPICNANSDEIHKCYNCGAKFHGCCAARYSLNHNIGFTHIYRCPQCDTLLKMDEEFMEMIEEEMEEFYSEEEYQEMCNSIEEYEDTSRGEIGKYEYKAPSYENNMEKVIEEKKDEIQIHKIKSPKESGPPLGPPPSPQRMKKVKVGGFFGQKIDLKLRHTHADDIYMPTQSGIKVKETNTKRSITSLKPPKSKKRDRIQLCQICGTTVRNSKICPNCGAKLN